MYKILQLTVNEANVLDEIIRIYKLPLEVCVGDPESDYIVDLETEDNYSLLDGVYEILEADGLPPNNAFTTGVMVTLKLDVNNSKAYIQNSANTGGGSKENTAACNVLATAEISE